MVHAATSGSASWRMKPSARRPQRASAFGPVGGHEDVEAPAVSPRDLLRLPAAGHLPPLREALDDLHGLGQGGERAGGAADDPEGGVPPADPAHRAFAEHLVEGREQRCGHRPVPGAGVRHHGPHLHPAGGREDPGEDDERLLPQDVGVERPGVGESQRLRPLGEVDGPRRGRVGLENDAEFHGSCPSGLPQCYLLRPRRRGGGGAARTGPRLLPIGAGGAPPGPAFPPDALPIAHEARAVVADPRKPGFRRPLHGPSGQLGRRLPIPGELPKPNAHRVFGRAEDRTSSGRPLRAPAGPARGERPPAASIRGSGRSPRWRRSRPSPRP